MNKSCTLAATFMLVSLARPTALSAQSLVHLWAFNEPVGFTTNFSDTSGSGNNGTGAGDIVSDGKFGNAVSLLPGSSGPPVVLGDGVDNTSASNLPTGANDSWTINVWTKFASGNGPGALEYIAGFGIDDEEDIPTPDINARKARSVISFTDAANKAYHFWGSVVDVDAGFPYPADDQWHMQTVTYDGATTDLSMYFDGVRVARRNFGGTTPFVDAPAEVHVGNPSNWNENFEGKVDEFGIWNGALSPTQIGGLLLHNNSAQPETVQPTALVNRATGHITLSNLAAADFGNITGYEINSASGALEPGSWLTITGRLDNGQGVNPIDNGPWTVSSSTESKLAETDQSAPHGTLHTGQSIDFGAIWTKSRFNDVVITLKTDDGTSVKNVDVIVGYSGTAYSRSDLNLDGSVTLADWKIFSMNGLTSLAGLSLADAAVRGDLDGDGDNDRSDFQLFRTDYNAVNGAGAFEAALAAVPEPSTAAGMIVLGAAAWAVRRKR